MKHLSILVLFLFVGQAFAQKKHCFCEKDTLMSESLDCDTIVLKNHSKLYWQLTCDRIWLTLENTKKQKKVIDEVDIELYGYTYRLGFNLLREYKNSLLFRGGCSATGPCSYYLIDKTTGKQIEKFGQLICIDTDVLYSEQSFPYPFDFIVYLDDSEHLVVRYIDTKKTIKVPFKDKLTQVIPEQQFDSMTVKNNVLTIFYGTEETPNTSIQISLDEPKQK